MGTFSDIDNEDVHSFDFFLQLNQQLRDYAHIIRTKRRLFILCVKEHAQDGVGVDIQIHHALLKQCISEQLQLFVQLEQVDLWLHMCKSLSIAATIAFTPERCE